MPVVLEVIGKVLDLLIGYVGKEEARKQLEEAIVRAANLEADLLEQKKFGRVSLPD